ncbi:MAG: TIGR02466 family protein [Sphingomonadaceae bacterium]
MPEIKVTRQELFPTTVWSFDLSHLQEFFPGWLELISNWRAAAPAPAGRPHRGGGDSATRVMQMPFFAPLELAARAAFAHAFEEMRLSAPLRFRLEGWVNLLEQGGYNLPHQHPNRLLSACFYLQVPAGAAPLAFHDPRPAIALTAMPGQGANCGGISTTAPFAGQLLVFPHWLQHQVDGHVPAVPRISIGINALPA